MDDEIIAANYGVTCRYTPTIMDGPVFRWGNERGRDLVSASREGVMVNTGGRAWGASLPRLVFIIQLAEQVYRLLDVNDRNTDGCKQIIQKCQGA